MHLILLVLTAFVLIIMESNIRIIHLLTANRVHICVDIMKIFYSKYKDLQQLFVIIGANSTTINVYQYAIDECKIPNYVYVNSFEDITRNKNQWANKLILTHGLTYIECVRLCKIGFNNVHWICWGDGTKPSMGVLGKLFRPIKANRLKKIKGIVTLMQPDMDYLKHNYGLDNVICLPYHSFVNEENIPLCDALNTTIHNNILLGNNSGCIDDYINNLDLLENYKTKVNVACLLNYSLKKDERYYSLRKKGHDYFGERFTIIEKLMSQSEYIQFLKNYDVYICGKQNQTGLGAIYRMLASGKKIFINGKNYEWVKEIGCEISNVSEIEGLEYDKFIEPLPTNIKKENHDKIIHFINDGVDEKWREFMVSNCIY